MIFSDRRALSCAALSGALCLSLLLPSCSSTGGSSETQPKLSDSSSSEKEDGGKAHALVIAELGLEQARLEGEQGQAKADLELVMAVRKLAQAKMELQVFKKSRDRRQAEAQLDYDQAAGRASDAEAELAELEAMYAEEEFAEKTKELVLNRGRRNLEHARRGLEIQAQKLQQLVEFDLPKEQAEKDMAVDEAERKLEQARRALELAKVKGRTAVAKAEQALKKAKKDEA